MVRRGADQIWRYTASDVLIQGVPRFRQNGKIDADGT